MIDEYNRAKQMYEKFLIGDTEHSKGSAGGILWLMGAGDYYVELGIIEDKMMEALQGLS